MSEDQAGIPSVSTSGSVFAAIGPSTPEWRRIVKVTGDPMSGYQTEIVQDYTLVKAVEQALEQADSDDPPAQQQLLMSAWQALAMYLSSCDDEDKAGALNALKVVSNLMNDNDADGPTPAGTFGTTMQTAAAASDFTCPMEHRTFGTEAGLINHLKTMHAAREKQAGYGKNPAAQDQD